MTDSIRPKSVDPADNPPPEGHEIFWYRGPRNLKLRACKAPSTASTPRGTVLVCPGRSEYIEKYYEVARQLQDRGFAVLIYDWPGQGLSERLLDNRLKGHVDSFDTYTGAMALGLRSAGDMPQPFVSLAHSMGGAISLAAICNQTLKIDAAAFCAPMWGLPFGAAARFIARAMFWIGRGDQFFRPPGPDETFEDNHVTYDRAHWQLDHDLKTANPDLKLGPPTWGWATASLNVLAKITHPQTLANVDIPVFVATAADEKLVDNTSHNLVATHLPDCEHIKVEGAMHEILMEKPDKRAAFWQGFDRLLKRAGI